MCFLQFQTKPPNGRRILKAKLETALTLRRRKSAPAQDLISQFCPDQGSISNRQLCDQMTTPPYGRWLLNCTTPPIPTSGRGCGTWLSRKVKNSEVHAREGNHRQALVLAQNVPQIYKNVASIGAHLDLLVEEYKPTVLFITELPEDKVEMCAPKGYVHVVKRSHDRAKKIRTFGEKKS